jgi:putative glycosyltransferase (TIGR04372 family)
MHALVGRSGPHLTFTPEEEELGRAALRSLGLPDGAPLVCFHARDAAYLASAIPGNQWDYHNFRDASIQGYIPAAEELGRRGYFALRMGAVVKEQLNTTNPRIVDYATNHRSDFLDIFLCGKCEFFLGSHTGLYTVASMFRRPVALVNVVPIFEAPTWGPRDLFIPKKLWLRQERRFMTFREVFDSGVAEFQTTAQYQQLGIEVVENTAEEITALAVEMDERLKGAWQTTEEDEALQARFWALFKVKQWHGPVVSRIGAEFLRHNQALLV